jgi:hypothetical protein
MKHVVRVVSLCLLFMAGQNCNGQLRSVADLAGRWVSSEGITGSLEFIEGSKVIANVSGMEVPPTTYILDFSRDPIWFDVFVAQGRTVKGLLQFIDDDTIKWQVILDGDRPNDFTDGPPGPMILKRQK